MADASITVVTTEAGDYVVVRVHGELTTREAFRIRARAVSRHPGLPRMWDFRQADLSSWTQDEIRAMAESLNTRRDGPATRVAALVSRDIEFGISRIFEVLAEDLSTDQFDVFRLETDAVGWLLAIHGEAPE